MVLRALSRDKGNDDFFGRMLCEPKHNRKLTVWILPGTVKAWKRRSTNDCINDNLGRVQRTRNSPDAAVQWKSLKSSVTLEGYGGERLCPPQGFSTPDRSKCRDLSQSNSKRQLVTCGRELPPWAAGKWVSPFNSPPPTYKLPSRVPLRARLLSSQPSNSNLRQSWSFNDFSPAIFILSQCQVKWITQITANSSSLFGAFRVPPCLGTRKFLTFLFTIYCCCRCGALEQVPTRKNETPWTEQHRHNT